MTILTRFKRPLMLGVIVLALSLFVLVRGQLTQASQATFDFDKVSASALPERSFARAITAQTGAKPQGVATSFYSDQGLSVSLNEAQRVDYTLTVETTGWYQLSVEMQDTSLNLLTNRVRLLLNGESPYIETDSLALRNRWNMPATDFPLDRYGHEIMPVAFKDSNLRDVLLFDATALTAEPLRFYLIEGTHTVRLEHIQGVFNVAALTLRSVPEIPTYEAILADFNDRDVASQTIIIPAESFVAKSNPSTRLLNLNDPQATQYDTRFQRLNTLDGWSFRHGGDALYYRVNVEEAGWYNLSFKYRQNYLMQMPVFRELRINGEVPFVEAQWLPFHYSNNFTTTTLGDDEPYWFYFEEGEHELSLRVVLEPYRNSYHQIVRVMEEMTDLSLEIKRLTGNTRDRYRNWRLEQFIPDVGDRLDRWIATLENIEEGLNTYAQVAQPGELTHIVIARRHLETLQEDLNDLPNQLTLLSDGDASAAQLLGTAAQIFLENGLDIEVLFLAGDAPLPRTQALPWVRLWESTKRFFLSFGQQGYTVTSAAENTLEIWVNYPRQYVEIMQQIIDAEFTPLTGINVQLSIMPDENKLILANAANAAPDIALGVNHWVPYEFAIRGASLDLRQFEGYEDTVSHFAPGVMIPYAFEEGMFGLPLTQNFWVTFYRRDILNSLNLPVPDTWEEVVQILPELQRFGMNYFHPIAQFGGFKPFVATIPFIYQFGGELYTDDGMQTLLNSDTNLEGVRLMTELFTIYDMPKQVPNFYNHFRTGLLPIGISDLATYLQLTIAAPEIAGQWNIAPHPGLRQEDGTVSRYAASGAQSLMILSGTEKPDEAWRFIEWFLDTPTQVNFAYRLQTAYGTEFLWNTANLEAFRQVPLPPEHIDVILAQWEFAMEASRIPGYYMVERELSNAWNRIVFNDANPRITLDNAVRIANREIIYRMEEFGYVDQGQVIRPYNVPTIRNIHEWLKERPRD